MWPMVDSRLTTGEASLPVSRDILLEDRLGLEQTDLCGPIEASPDFNVKQNKTDTFVGAT